MIINTDLLPNDVWVEVKHTGDKDSVILDYNEMNILIVRTWHDGIRYKLFTAYGEAAGNADIVYLGSVDREELNTLLKECRSSYEWKGNFK